MSAYASSSGSESDKDDSWDDFTPDDQIAHANVTYSLFDQQKQFQSPQEALEHDKQAYGVDVPLLAATLGKSPLGEPTHPLPS